MGSTASKVNKKTKDFNHCKESCWKNIETPLSDGFKKSLYKKVANNSVLQYDTDGFEYRIKNNREILTIGCTNCKFPCENNCMAIIVLNETKGRMADSGYLVMAFKNNEAAYKYINAYYPDGTTRKFNDDFFKQKGWEAKSRDIDSGMIDYKNNLSASKAYDYIKELYSL